MACDIENAAPIRALDAGCGRLRHLGMFRYYYVGISHDVADCLAGLQEDYNVVPLASGEKPEIYLMRLESDFSFLGPFDMCVCTDTIYYVQDPLDLVIRLANLVQKNGALILSDIDLARLPDYLALLKHRFADIETIYWGHADLNRYDKAWSEEDIRKLTRAEMEKPNTPDQHSHFYIRASGKHVAPLDLTSPMPAAIDYQGLRIVKEEVPYLKNLPPLKGRQK